MPLAFVIRLASPKLCFDGAKNVRRRKPKLSIVKPVGKAKAIIMITFTK